MAIIIITLILYLIFNPTIDKTPEDKYILWYNGFNKRNFIILN